MSTSAATQTQPQSQSNSNVQINILSVNQSTYGEQNYRSHMMEQYKIYVEMADRVSARRMLSNTFFLTVHTTFITTFSLLKGGQSFAMTVIPLVAAIILCIVWWFMVRSYKQLNSGKFTVINEMEKHMPVSLYDAEWRYLDHGKKISKYFTLTRVELIVPMVFGLLYVSLGVWLFYSV